MKAPEKILLTQEKADRIRERLERLYGREAAPGLLRRFQMMLGRYGVGLRQPEELAPLFPAAGQENRWSENSTVLITYADSISSREAPPLQTLHRFLSEHLRGVVETIHLLPFYPWSSDDGFSVIDYREVEPRYGSWIDIEHFTSDFRLMFDLVLNHCSRRSQWFRDFVTGIAPARYYFLWRAHPKRDAEALSRVVRPRSSPLLSKTAIRDGETWVWTTFSDDQVDLDWNNSDVLFEFLDILFLYLAKGAGILRLDAVAFLWKRLGTDCLHLPETHEVVKLLRDVVDLVAPSVTLLTETNVPHEENLSYFGEGDEAHMVYNFTLPPLLLYSLLRNDATHLTRWASTLPVLPEGRAFLNFTASHDGIGVRPLQGIVEEAERDWLVDEVRRRNGLVSLRSLPDGSQSPYELNITYLDALGDPTDAELGLTRFLCSQALLLAFPGVPALYIHSLLGTPNHLAGVEMTGQNRTINRRKYPLDELRKLITDPECPQARVFSTLLTWLRRRRDHPAFHPNAPMEVRDLGEAVFAFVRNSLDGGETIACAFNFTAQPQSIRCSDLHRGLARSGHCRDLLNDEEIATGPRRSIELKPYHARWLRV